MSANAISTQLKTEAVDRSRFWLAAAIALIGAVIANLGVRFALFALLPLPADFQPLQVTPVAAFTLFGVLMASGVYAGFLRWSRRPITTFRWVAVITLILSILPNFGAMANPAMLPFQGGSAAAYGALIVFHIVAALVSVLALTELTRKGEQNRV